MFVNVFVVFCHSWRARRHTEMPYSGDHQNIASLYSMPKLAIAKAEINAGIPAITKSLAVSRHLLEMYRRQLSDEHARRKLLRLENRLTKIAAEVQNLSHAQK